MLTVPKEELNEETEYYILAWSDEGGGKGGVDLLKGTITLTHGKYLGLPSPGGDPGEFAWASDEIEVWGSDYYKASIFASEEARKLGAAHILNMYGDDIILSVYKPLKELVDA